MIDCFISHRCKDYDNSLFRPPFEKYLKRLYLKPKYGCTLYAGKSGFLENKIAFAMENSEIFIAVVTESWAPKHKPVWPPKEFEMWQSIKKDTPAYDRCIGLLIETEREHIDYLSELVTLSVYFHSSTFPTLQKPSSKFKVNLVTFLKENEYDYVMEKQSINCLTKTLDRYKKDAIQS